MSLSLKPTKPGEQGSPEEKKPEGAAPAEGGAKAATGAQPSPPPAEGEKPASSAPAWMGSKGAAAKPAEKGDTKPGGTQIRGLGSDVHRPLAHMKGARDKSVAAEAKEAAVAVVDEPPPPMEGVPQQEDPSLLLAEEGRNKWQKLWLQHQKLILIGAGAMVAVFVLFGVVGAGIYGSYVLSSSKELVEAGKHREALPKLKSYIEGSPEDLDARVLYARALLSNGDGEAAGSELDYVAARDVDRSEDPDFRYYQAWQVAVQNPESGNSRVRLVLDADADHVAARFMAALNHLREKRPNEAVTGFKRALLANRNRADAEDRAINARRLDYWRNFFFDNYFPLVAETLPTPFETLPAPYPPAASFGVQAGVRGFKNYYTVPFSADLRRLTLSADANIRVLQAFAHLNGGDPGGAVAILQQVADNEDNPVARFMIAFVRAKEGDYAQAAEEYGNIPKLMPSPLAGIMRANALWIAGGGQPPDEEVLKIYDGAAKSRANDAAALNNAGFMHLYAGDIEAARPLFVAALSASATDPNALFNQMLIDMNDGDFESARSKLHGVTEVWPDSANLLNIAFALETRSGNAKAAKEIAEGIKARNPDNPQPYLTLAKAYRQDRNMVLGLLELENASRKFPNSAEVQSEYALALVRRRQWDKAENVLAELGAEAGDMPFAIVAQAYLNAREEGPESGGEYFTLAWERAEGAQKNQIALMWAGFLLSHENPDEALSALARIEAGGEGEREKLQTEGTELLAQVLLGEKTAEDAVALRDRAGEENIEARLLALEALHHLGDEEAEEQIRAIPDFRDDLLLALDRGEEAEASEDDETTEVDASEGVVGIPDEQAHAINAAIAKGDFEEAINLYSKLLQRFPNVALRQAATFQNRGALYLKVKNYSAAAADFASSLKHKKTMTRSEINAVRYNYAFALINTGAFEEAEEQLKLAMEQRLPSRGPYLALMAMAVANQGRGEEAISILRDMFEQDKNLFTYFLRVANVFKRKKDHKSQESALLAAQEANPRSVQVQQQLIDLYSKLGDTAKIDRHMQIIQQISGQ